MIEYCHEVRKRENDEAGERIIGGFPCSSVWFCDRSMESPEKVRVERQTDLAPVGCIY